MALGGIISGINNCEFGLLTISMKEFALKDKVSSIEEAKDFALNLKQWEFNHTTNFSYDTLMGREAMSRNGDLCYITANDGSGNLIFDSTYANAMQAAGIDPKGSKEITDEAICKFIESSAGTPQSAKSWADVMNGIKEEDKTIAENQSEIEKLKAYDYDTPAKTAESNRTAAINKANTTFNTTIANINRDHDTAVNVAEQKYLKAVGTDNEASMKEEWESVKSEEDAKQTRLINEAYEAQQQAIKDAEEAYNEEIKQNVTDKKAENEAKILEHQTAINEAKTRETEAEESDRNNFLKYKDLFIKACAQGWQRDDKISDKEYMTNQMVNGKYLVNKESIKNSKDFQETNVNDSELVNNYYKAQLQACKAEEKALAIQRTNLTTTKQALEKQYQSAKSMLDDQIQREFDFF